MTPDEAEAQAETQQEPDRLDAPNQQVVRPDGSGPADEGEGGSTRGREDEAKQDKPKAKQSKQKGGT